MSQQQLKKPLGNAEVPVKTCTVGAEGEGLRGSEGEHIREHTTDGQRFD